MFIHLNRTASSATVSQAFYSPKPFIRNTSFTDSWKGRLKNCVFALSVRILVRSGYWATYCTNYGFYAPGLVVNLATLNFSSFQNLPLNFFLKNGTAVEETYTFMEICWSEISRDLEISYKFQVETWSSHSKYTSVYGSYVNIMKQLHVVNNSDLLIF